MRGPRDYLDAKAFYIFGKSVPMRNFKKILFKRTS